MHLQFSLQQLSLFNILNHIRIKPFNLKSRIYPNQELVNELSANKFRALIRRCEFVSFSSWKKKGKFRFLASIYFRLLMNFFHSVCQSSKDKGLKKSSLDSKFL